MGHWFLASLSSVVLLAADAATAAHPSFTDVTEQAGVDYQQHAAAIAPDCIFGDFCEPDRMTGGAAVGDIDGDYDLDLLVTRLDAPDILFRNRGDGTFEDVTIAAGLAFFDLQSNGAGFADIDNDDDLDLYVTTVGAASDPVNNRNYLFINDGFGGFQEQALARGAAIEGSGVRRGFSVAFGDYDRDGWVDAHVTEWLPDGESHARLLRNRGPKLPGFFEDVTDDAGVGLADTYSFTSTFTDLDLDGWPDLAVAADFGTSRLFWNLGDGTFVDGTADSGVGTDENGMGSTVGDVDGDGDLDWFVTSIFDPKRTCATQTCNWGYTGNRLYRNEGARVFSDATDAAGVRNGYWGWGSKFFDYDNDGDLDLVMTNGIDLPAVSADAAFNSDPIRFWENDGAGIMTEVSAQVGLTDTQSGKGLLVFDYDDDGDLDLLVVNNAGHPRLYRNDGGNANGWLRVKTVGTASNRDGIGARIRVQAEAGGTYQVREVGTSYGFLGQGELIAHFGLGSGSAPVARVEVTWPRSGWTVLYENVPRGWRKGVLLCRVKPLHAVEGVGTLRTAFVPARGPLEFALVSDASSCARRDP